MGPGYAASAGWHAPQAVICIDPYHVVQLANKALDEIRRAYWNELRQSGDQEAAKRFKDARWSLLKIPEKLTDKQAATLQRLKAAGGELWRGYTLKEATRGIFAPGLTVADVEILIDRLLSRLARSRLEPFVRLGKTIRKHRDGILAAIRLGINQGRTEALNNKVRLIIRRLRLPHRPGGPRPRDAHLRPDHAPPAAPASRHRFTVTLTTSMPREPLHRTGG
jgi:transposase